MRAFEHVAAPTVADAVAFLDDGWNTRLLAGGTDVLPALKDDVYSTSRLVSLSRISDLRGIEAGETGLRIGALVTLDDLLNHPVVEESYPTLWHAVRLAASPQLRNMGTLGGNLGQDSRCWYYRGPFECWLKGGETCYARDGENRLHAIFDQSPCVSTHPTDPGTALVALDATLRLQSAQGETRRPIAEHFAPPTEERRRLNTLAPDEVIVGIDVPAPAAGSQGIYLKAMDRALWGFALVSAAVVLHVEGDTIADGRLALGGVANTPWRAQAAEAALRGQTLTEATIAAAANAATEGATPLAHTGYKVELTRALVRRALETLRA
jgi:xanthine dehydrogenase YagS FAD-binding subunit